MGARVVLVIVFESAGCLFELQVVSGRTRTRTWECLGRQSGALNRFGVPKGCLDGGMLGLSGGHVAAKPEHC